MYPNKASSLSKFAVDVDVTLARKTSLTEGVDFCNLKGMLGISLYFAFIFKLLMMGLFLKMKSWLVKPNRTESKSYSSEASGKGPIGC